MVNSINSPSASPHDRYRKSPDASFFDLSQGLKPSLPNTPFVYSTPIKKTYKRWPYIVVFLCACIVTAGYTIRHLPVYRLNYRYDLYELFGAKNEEGQWVGGHREVVDFVTLGVCIALPTLIGGIAMSAGNALPPVPRGVYRTLSRFLSRKWMFLGLNISIGEAMFILIFLGLNGIWFASIFGREYGALTEGGAPVDDKWSIVTSVGYTLGFNAVFLFSLLVFPATRNCFWMLAIGIDYSHSVKYHRWLGALSIILVALHAIPYYKTWLQNGEFIEKSIPCFTCDFGEANNRKVIQNFAGQICMLCLIIMGITSLYAVRRRFFELFYYTHHLFIVILFAMCVHYSSFVMWMFPAINVYAMHRILSRSQARIPCEMVDLEAIPGQITRLVFRRSPGKAGHYHAGQFVYLRIPLLSSTQWHPFSISSSPVEFEDTFTVHVKAIGTWSKELYAVAIQAREERKMPLIYVDGFYGKMSDEFQHYPALVLIAGGIGATPIISILGKILDCMRCNETVMQNVQVYFHWTSREIGIFHEFEPLLDALEDFDPDHRTFRVRLCFTGDQHLGGVDLPNGITLKPMDDTSMVPTRPFHQSARSVPRQVMLFLLMFVAGFVALFFMRWGYPLLGGNRENQGNWPLQRVLELIVVLAGAALGWIIIATEPRPRAMSRMEKARLLPHSIDMSMDDDEDFDRDSVYSNSLSFDGQDVQFNHPVCRTRLNIPELLSDVVKEQSHNYTISVTGIGTWVSGPMGMIHAVEREAANYAGIFDVHYEEFEM